MSDILEFIGGYKSTDIRQIGVDDRNVQYRQDVIASVVANLSVTGPDLLRDLVEQEGLWSSFHDIDYVALGTLLSRLLDVGGLEEVYVLFRIMGRNQDLDGYLLSKGLVLAANRRKELLDVLDKRAAAGAVRTIFMLARDAVSNAKLASS